MQKLTIFTAIISLVLALAACSPPNRAGAEGSAITLPGTAWAVKAIAGNSVQGNLTVTVNFGEDGRISGTSGCNRYFSDYKVDSNTLTIGLIAGTKMMCGPDAMKIEHNFLSLLHKAETFSVSNTGSLVITANNGDMIKAAKSETKH